MARKKEATIIVLDVGENTLVSSGKDGKSFFERAKACVSKIIQKKIFAKPNDEIGLILMGAEETNNDLNGSLTGFENIVEKIFLQCPTWEMIREIEKLEISDFSSDWVDGLVVALNFAKNETQAKKFSNVRILLITNFVTTTSDSNLDVVVNSIKEAKVELVAISDCVEHVDQMKNTQFSQDPSKSAAQTASQKLYNEVIEQVGGHLCHIDLAEAQLLMFQKKQTSPMPWNATLTIGSKLNIPISAYVSIQEEKLLASFKTESVTANTVTRMESEYTRNNEIIEKPDEKDTIKAYMYGTSLVAVDDEDIEVATEKCFSCLGFSKRELVLSEYMSGDGCHIVLPQKDNVKAGNLFGGLVRAMKDGDFVMIARKVYRNKLNPIIVALLPSVEDEVPYLTMIQLAYFNDISLFSFPRLNSKKSQPTEEQEKIIKNLVDTMDLMKGVDDDSGLTEAFALETSLNPVNQHLCRSVAYRALHPSDPLPTIDPELIAMIDIPPKIKNAIESIVKEVEEKFPLEIVERKVKKVFGQRNTEAIEDEPVADDEEDEEKKIIAVGTVTPAEDFEHLLKKGLRFTEISAQLQVVIFDLIFRTASIQKEKILLCIMMYRDKAKIFVPFDYNKWIMELKNTMIQRNRVDLWQDLVVKEGLGLITVNESAISTITIEEQLAFYEINKSDNYQTSAMNVDDEDDLDAFLG